MESKWKIENSTQNFRETNLVLLLIQESQIKGKAVMRKKRAIFVQLVLS